MDPLLPEPELPDDGADAPEPGPGCEFDPPPAVAGCDVLPVADAGTPRPPQAHKTTTPQRTIAAKYRMLCARRQTRVFIHETDLVPAGLATRDIA